jgi:SAM-dependent methyltransferase
MTAGTNVFDRCPLCESAEVAGRIRSIEKDMSRAGFSYVRCSSCASYYLRDVTVDALEAFYGSLPPYESSSSKVEIVEELARTLGLTGTERVLDLGCGSGAWALPLLAYCGHLTCVDVDANGVELLRQRVPDADKARVDCHSAHSLAFLEQSATDSFDLVLSMFSLEHDVNPRQVLAHIRRVLRPGGRAVVLVPSADALQLAMLGGGFYWFQAPWHTFIPASAGLRVAASRAGFSECRVVVTASPFYSWFWIRGFADRWRLRGAYNRLRALRWFVKTDIALDELLDRLSFRLRRPSYGLYLLER